MPSPSHSSLRAAAIRAAASSSGLSEFTVRAALYDLAGRPPREGRTARHSPPVEAAAKAALAALALTGVPAVPAHAGATSPMLSAAGPASPAGRARRARSIDLARTLANLSGRVPQRPATVKRVVALCRAHLAKHPADRRVAALLASTLEAHPDAR